MISVSSKPLLFVNKLLTVLWMSLQHTVTHGWHLYSFIVTQYSVEVESGLFVQTARVQILTLPLISGVTLGNLLNLCALVSSLTRWN